MLSDLGADSGHAVDNETLPPSVVAASEALACEEATVDECMLDSAVLIFGRTLECQINCRVSQAP